MSRNIATITIDLEMSSATMASSKTSSTAPIRKNDLICQLKEAVASTTKIIAKCDNDGAPVLTATEKRAHVEALRLALPLLAKERQRLERRKASTGRKALDASIRRMVATLRRRRCDRRAFRSFSVKASLARFVKGSTTKPDLYDLYVLGDGYHKQCTVGHKRKRDMMDEQGFKRTDKIPTAAESWYLACKAHPRLLYLCMDTAKHPTYWTWRDVKEHSAALKALLLGQTRGGYSLSEENIAWLKAADEVDLVKQCKTKPSSVLDAEKLPTIDVCFQDRWGDTALMHAARKGGVPHVRALLKHGGTSLEGDVNKKQLTMTNIKGETALVIAQKKGFAPIVALLEKAAGEE